MVENKSNRPNDVLQNKLNKLNKLPNKLAETRQGIAEFRQLFSGEEVELYGTKVRLATARRQIPIYLAVSQPGMLRLCGETCDGAVLMGAADPEFCNWLGQLWWAIC